MISLFTKKDKTKPKVKLIAVAKDEAAYLPEWIHHHLYFGFDVIDIYINRTSDNSTELVQTINKLYPNVNCFNLDWVDLCPEGARNHIQQIAYSLGLQQARDSKQFDYVMFLDIDEFWMPRQLDVSIQDVLLQLNLPDSVSFQWFNEQGRDESFMPLGSTIYGSPHKLIKSVFKVGLKIDSMSLHLPRFKGGSKMLADGSRFAAAPGHHEQLKESLSKLRSVMVVHRMFRSPLEYVSLLNRGRPSKAKLTIKTNRFGYNIDNSERLEFALNSENYELYENSYQEFIQQTGVEHAISLGRQFVAERYNQTVKSIENIPLSHAKEALRAFRRCTGDAHKALCTKYGSERFINSLSTPALLRDMAHMFMLIDLPVAQKLISRALTLHPTGPQIITLAQQVERELAEQR